MIELQHCAVSLAPDFTFGPVNAALTEGRHVAITGKNGSGKSALAAILAGEGEVVSGERRLTCKTGWVSTAQQQALIAQEKKKDDADILDVIPVPSTAREVILRQINMADCGEAFTLLTSGLRMVHFLDNAFLGLSTGETRKVLLVRTLLASPDVLVLDEPMDGLDTASCEFLHHHLQSIQHRCTIVMALNRLSEIPPFVRQLWLMQQGQLSWQSDGGGVEQSDLAHLKQLLHMENTSLTLPEKDETRYSPQMAEGENVLVKLVNGKVSYDNRTIFSGLNWQINRGEHWQVTGPNGSGKTCLLNMITGDDPHCYTNELTVFGYKRGSGESIWDIKQHIGLVSNSFHLQYRVNCSVLHVVLSGFYDSIGLYEQPDIRQKQLAREWLALAGMAHRADEPFQSLSFGDQRLLLILRAMVKHPTLLILDEPCNGLDEINRLKVLALLGIIAAGKESTLLYVNHHSEDKINGVELVLALGRHNQEAQA
ncbi:MAG: molybdate ABC transporter ATP-binding protein ModF [Alteromonadaceae bacterium]|nr:molybdate ABC transporter ATP-binding protein ModF [Alteromonadaceae bacterium]